MRDRLTLSLSAVVRRESEVYAAFCPEYELASEGESVEEAVRRLKEAVEVFLEGEPVELPSVVGPPLVAIDRVDVQN